jgi:hypothetical protein
MDLTGHPNPGSTCQNPGNPDFTTPTESRVLPGTLSGCLIRATLEGYFTRNLTVHLESGFHICRHRYSTRKQSERASFSLFLSFSLALFTLTLWHFHAGSLVLFTYTLLLSCVLLQSSFQYSSLLSIIVREFSGYLFHQGFGQLFR